MRTKLKLVAYVLLICLCIGIFAGCCANSDKGSDNYEDPGNNEWYIKIYMPDGCIEGPGKIIYISTSVILVEIDGIQYKVGSQNFLARKLPES